MDKPLTQQELVAVLDQWAGGRVTVRVVSKGDELLAVSEGRLEPRSPQKQPALFWPLSADQPPHFEQPGIYLHPERFEEASLHEGEFVLELRQDEVTLNLRRL